MTAELLSNNLESLDKTVVYLETFNEYWLLSTTDTQLLASVRLTGLRA